MRPEPAYLRRARQMDLAARRLRLVDLLALMLGYGLLLSMLVGGAITLVDWLEGLPHSVWPEIAALLARLD